MIISNNDNHDDHEGSGSEENQRLASLPQMARRIKESFRISFYRYDWF